MIFGLSAYLFAFVNPWLAVFVALTAVCSAFPVMDRFAYWRREAIVFGAVWYAFIKGLDREHVLNAVCVVSLINVFAVFLQMVGADPYSFFTFGLMDGDTAGRITGLMFNENELSALLGVSFAAFIRPTWFLCIPAIVLALFFSKSTVGVAAVFAGMCVFLYSHRKLYLIWPVLVLGVAYVIFWDTNIGQSGSWRLEYLSIAERIISAHPFGIGLGHWHLVTNQMHAHNDIAQMTVETGVIGLGVMAGFIFSYFRNTDLMGMMFLSAIVVTSLVSFAWFIPTTALIMATLLATGDKCLKN